VKTALFSIHDQVNETEPDWGDGASGFAKRVGSLHAGKIIQKHVKSTEPNQRSPSAIGAANTHDATAVTSMPVRPKSPMRKRRQMPKNTGLKFHLGVSFGRSQSLSADGVTQ
jgi:hypothetical protein